MMELMDVPAMDASEMAFVLDLRRKDAKQGALT